MKVVLTTSHFRLLLLTLLGVLILTVASWYFVLRSVTTPYVVPLISATAISSIYDGADEPVSVRADPTERLPLFSYIEITNGCGPYYDTDTCVNLRAGPGTDFAIVERLRTGLVLKVSASTTFSEGREWYRVIFDGELRYPERVSTNWYVAADPEYVTPLINEGDLFLTPQSATSSTKRIEVDLSSETLTAYDGDTVFMSEPISTGLEFTPTPRGRFRIFKKTPSRYMQGPIPDVSDQYYDLPGVPWNLYFTRDGAVIHGAYWHDRFGEPWSHGCVNLPPQMAKMLYMWADIGTYVVVHE